MKPYVHIVLGLAALALTCCSVAEQAFDELMPATVHIWTFWF